MDNSSTSAGNGAVEEVCTSSRELSAGALSAMDDASSTREGNGAVEVAGVRSNRSPGEGVPFVRLEVQALELVACWG